MAVRVKFAERASDGGLVESDAVRKAEGTKDIGWLTSYPFSGSENGQVGGKDGHHGGGKDCG